MTEPCRISSSNPATIALPENWNYEAAVAKVETITAEIEAGELELEEVFEQFAAAVEYLHQCETFLQRQHQQVDLLIENLKDEPQF